MPAGLPFSICTAVSTNTLQPPSQIRTLTPVTLNLKGNGLSIENRQEKLLEFVKWVDAAFPEEEGVLGPQLVQSYPVDTE